MEIFGAGARATANYALGPEDPARLATLAALAKSAACEALGTGAVECTGAFYLLEKRKGSALDFAAALEAPPSGVRSVVVLARGSLTSEGKAVHPSIVITDEDGKTTSAMGRSAVKTFFAVGAVTNLAVPEVAPQFRLLFVRLCCTQPQI